jgi:hypothetical protein
MKRDGRTLESPLHGLILLYTRLENTHGAEIRELLYPWLPWFALWVTIHKTIDSL